MLEDMFTRVENAQTRFIDSLKEQFGYTTEQATKILNVYKRAKVVKLDPIGGCYNLKHGAFWEKDVLDRALAVE